MIKNSRAFFLLCLVAWLLSSLPLFVEGFVGGNVPIASYSPGHLRVPRIRTIGTGRLRMEKSEKESPKEEKLKILSSITTSMFPTIPEREVAPLSSLRSHFYPEVVWQSLKNQTRPRFVLDEFLYGFKYMCKVVPWLYFASYIAGIIRVLSLPITNGHNILMIGEPTQAMEGFFNYLETKIKRVVYQVLPSLTASDLVKGKIVAPLIEEATYRGLAHGYGWWFYCVVQCMIFAFFCRGSAMCASAYFILVSMISPYSILRGLMIPGTPVVCATHLRETLHQIVIAPVVWQLVRLKWNKRKYSSIDAKRGHGKNSQQRLSRILSAIVTGRIIQLPKSLEASICRALPLSARVCGATAFGNAHGFGCGLVPLPMGLVYLQKTFGTFASSMLVESRLVVKRKNLWAAIGAHAAFNAVFPLFYRFGVFWLLFPLWVMNVILDARPSFVTT